MVEKGDNIQKEIVSKKEYMKHVRKRDGTIVPFNEERIFSAIYKAAKAVGGSDTQKARELADQVVIILNNQFTHSQKEDIVTVETIQDTVERVLIKRGHAKTAKAYILYRQSHQELRDVKGLFDTIEAVDDYIDLDDWMVKENSNMGYSLQGLNNYLSTKIISNYWLRRIYPERIRKAHEQGNIHIHDLGTLGSYCVGWDLQDLLTIGFGGVSTKTTSSPPKHFRVALGQIVNFYYTLQGESAGAQAFSNVDTLLAPFIRYDNLEYEQILQALQEFVFNLNVPTRVGFQTPFTNITLDLNPPEHLADMPVIIGGKPQKETYKDFQKEMDLFNRAFAEVMLKGDANGKIFTFPIPTYNVTKDFDWQNPVLEPVWEMTAKYGIPYFSNFINSDMKPSDARSMCCRLRLDQAELRKRGGGLFGSNPLTGSIGVVTINMPAIGYTSTTKEQFFRQLDELMEIAKESLEIKRKAVEKLTKQGLYPYSQHYLRTVYERFEQYWANHFSTIGLLGMNEAILNFMPGETIATQSGRAFAHEVLTHMRERMKQFQLETSHLYNLEATPGEATSYRFARIDKKRFGDIKTANEEDVARGAKPYYTNSSQLPVNYTDDIFEAFTLQEPLQTLYTGGTVLHVFLGQKLTKDQAKVLVRRLAEQFSLPYFTITPTFSVCPIHGYIHGDHEYCPTCLAADSIPTPLQSTQFQEDANLHLEVQQTQNDEGNYAKNKM